MGRRGRREPAGARTKTFQIITNNHFNITIISNYYHFNITIITNNHFSMCACHPCAGAMLIFSVVPILTDDPRRESAKTTLHKSRSVNNITSKHYRFAHNTCFDNRITHVLRQTETNLRSRCSYHVFSMIGKQQQKQSEYSICMLVVLCPVYWMFAYLLFAWIHTYIYIYIYIYTYLFIYFRRVFRR